MDTITRGETSRSGVPQALRTKKSPNINVVSSYSHPLEAPAYQERLKRLMQWRRQARIAQADNRAEMATDEDFYDGIQLSTEDLFILNDRGQPVTVFNVIANTINWILGTERRSRIDSRVLPRKQSGATSAKAKSKMMKYTQDCSKGEYEWSFAFEECVKAGLGWLETGIRSNGDEPIFVKNEKWRNMWYDHLGMSLDGSDWRFQIREKWVDLDIAIGMFPDREGALKLIAENVNALYPYLPDDTDVIDEASEFDLESEIDALFGGSDSGLRERLKMVEMWYRVPDRVKLLKMRDDDTPFGALDGTIFRAEHQDHQYLVRGGYATLTDARILTVRCAIWTGSTYLQDILTPYNHNRFPFTPIFCYRRKRDGAPYGVIRNLRDPQSDLNKRRSRALFLLSSNRVIADKGAVDDKVEAMEEIQRPDGWVELNSGKKLEIQKDQEIASSHVELARDDERFIHNISGVTGELLDQPRTGLSGIAIGKLQNQGQVTQGVFFDNLYYALQAEGEIRLSLIEQFYDQKKEYRITGDQQKDEFITINEEKPDGTIENNITQSKADFIIGKQDFRETIRLSMLEMLSELVTNLSKSMPQVALSLLDMVVDYMDDLPNKHELVARIRKINGQDGPEDELTPEQKEERKQIERQKLMKQEAMEQINNAMIQADLAVKQATAAEKSSKVMKDRVEAAMKKLEGFLKALEVAGTLKATPDLAKAADNLLEDAANVEIQPQQQTGV